MRTDWTDFTDDDLGVLVEALEAWESKDFANEIAGEIFGAMFDDKLSPEQKAQRDRERQEAQLKRDRLKRLRKDQSVVLRAKLIQLRNARGVDRLEQSIAR